MMEGNLRKLLDESMRKYAERERSWWKNDRRGRWVVLEPGPGRLLRDAPDHVRDYVDAISDRRGRRFSSLSRARSFARSIGGEVHRWRRQEIQRVGRHKLKRTWRYETNPWASVQRHLPLWTCGAADLAGCANADG